jgi:hypothetical protein
LEQRLWDRLAQRIPVRIKLDDVPPDLLLVAGRTATVSIGKIAHRIEHFPEKACPRESGGGHRFSARKCDHSGIVNLP